MMSSPTCFKKRVQRRYKREMEEHHHTGSSISSEVKKEKLQVVQSTKQVVNKDKQQQQQNEEFRHEHNSDDTCVHLSCEPPSTCRNSALLILLELAEDLLRGQTFVYNSIHDDKSVLHCGKRLVLRSGKCRSSQISTTKRRQSHKITKMYKCPMKQCGREYLHRSSLYSHMKTHRESDQHKCEECGQIFSTQLRHERHIRTHTGYCPHKCHICGDLFKSLFNLSLHQALHTGDPNRCCNECGQMFYVHSQLVQHRIMSHGVKYFQCHLPTCRHRHFDKKGFRRHQRSLCHQKALKMMSSE